jgi:hypothetical protein
MGACGLWGGRPGPPGGRALGLGSQTHKGPYRVRSKASPWRLLAPLGVLLGIIALQIPAQVALGASGTCGTKGHYFDGMWVFMQNHAFANDVFANSESESAPRCGDQSNFAFWWVMIQHCEPGADGLCENGEQARGYAQIGFQRDNSSNYSFFWQYLTSTPGSTAVGASWGAPNFGVFHSLEVFRSTNSECPTTNKYCLLMYKDGSNCYTVNQVTTCMFTSFDPHNVWGGAYALAMGETQYPGEDMPGTSSAKTDFNSLEEEDGSALVHESWTPRQQCPSFYKQDVITSYTEFDIYTSSPSHGSTCS